MNQGLESDCDDAHQTLKYMKVKMRGILVQIEANQKDHPPDAQPFPTVALLSHHAQPPPIPARHSSIALEREFNSLFVEARAIDRFINPHPITRMPVDVVREIFEAAARADPDAPLLLARTCYAWERLAIETPKLWSDIRIDVDQDDALVALQLFLFLSKDSPLDIAITGGCASDEIINSLTPHVHRIRALELFLHREARVPFRVLGGTPPDGLSFLRRLAIKTAPDNGDTFVSLEHSLEHASDAQNTINETDLYLIKSLPLLSSLNALVLRVPGVVNMDQLQLPRVESLRLVMKDEPLVLEKLTCNNLKNLDVVLDDTSREGWWHLLSKSLTYPRLESLSLDVTLDQGKNRWPEPWNSRGFKRLAAQPTIRCVIVALSFSDMQSLAVNASTRNSFAPYREAHVEYLCSDLLRELTESVPSLKELRLLHVPYLHAPFIWPSPEVLCNLQRLEMHVPAAVRDEYIPVIELPNLRDLRFYGSVAPATTQLPRLRTPFLEHLEIMERHRVINPILMRGNRHQSILKERISYEKYSTSRGNTSKDFPTYEYLPKLELYLPVIHQSVALRELRLDFGNHKTEFLLTRFPELRVLQCSLSILQLIDAPKLEKFHALWQDEDRTINFLASPSVKATLRGLTTLELYSIYRTRFSDNADYSSPIYSDPGFSQPVPGDHLQVDKWMHCLHSLQTLILGQSIITIDNTIHCLWKNPTLCPRLTTIESITYPMKWSSLRDCIEKRNHLAMQDPSVHSIRTLRFPLALHRNISDRLKKSLSGEFAGPFVPVPLQPYIFDEPDHGPPERYLIINECRKCTRSGNAFICSRLEQGASICTHHENRSAGGKWGVTITANNMQPPGYLEGA